MGVVHIKGMKRDGLPIVDAKHRVNVVITEDDVKNAVPTDPTSCAIAQSLNRRGGVEQVSVGANIVFVKRKDRIERYVLPVNDRALIREFDKHDGIFPTQYSVTLEPPPSYLRIGARSGEKQGSEKRTGKVINALTRITKPPTRHVAAPGPCKKKDEG